MSTTSEHNIQCQICNSLSWRIILKDNNVSVCSGSELLKNDPPLIKVTCSNCAFTYTLVSPLDRDIIGYYKEGYSTKLENEKSDYYNYSVGKFFGDTLNQFVLSHSFPQKGKMLDIGCGKGFFEQAFLEKYPEWKAVGVDPSVKSIELAAVNAPQAEFFCKPFEPSEFAGQQFDLICMHTLLNRVSPRQFISSASSLIKENGVLSIAIAIFENAPFELYFADHHYMYFDDHLLALAEEYGFNLINADRRGSIWRFLFKKSTVHLDKRRFMLMKNSARNLAKVDSIVSSWRELLEKVNKLKLENKKLSFYGCGTTLRTILGQTDFPAELVAGIYDDNPHKHGWNWQGIMAKPYSEEIRKAEAIVLCAGPDGILAMKNKLGDHVNIIALHYDKL